MKHAKRKLLLPLSLLLVLSLACTALSQGHLLTLWNAGTALLFETSNVSLSGHATFTYDGIKFKVFDGTYVQDDYNSRMQVTMNTPAKDGSFTASGYTVVGDAETTYAFDNSASYYTFTNGASNATILTNTVMRESIMRFGGLLLDLLEDRMQGAITQTSDENGTQYRIVLAPGEAPAASGAALTLLMQLAGKEYFFIDPDDIKFGEPYTSVQYNNYDVLFAAQYEKTYGEKLPENFYSLLWDASGNATDMLKRQETISSQVYALYNQAVTAYPQGVTVIENDGSYSHFDSYDDYLIARGEEFIHYDDSAQTFKAWYNARTEQPLTDDDITALRRTTNEALHQSLTELRQQMREEYLSAIRAQGYSAATVHADGSVTGTNDARRMSEMNSLSSMTTTRALLYTLRSAEIDSCDALVSLDTQGNLTEVSGEVLIKIIDAFDLVHDLHVDFTGLAFDYGTSTVAPFDAAKEGLVSYNEYFSNPEKYIKHEEPVITNDTLPASIILNGVSYEVFPASGN